MVLEDAILLTEARALLARIGERRAGINPRIFLALGLGDVRLADESEKGQFARDVAAVLPRQSASIRVPLVHALGKIGGIEAEYALEAIATEDGSPEVRERAWRVARRITANPAAQSQRLFQRIEAALTPGNVNPDLNRTTRDIKRLGETGSHGQPFVGALRQLAQSDGVSADHARALNDAIRKLDGRSALKSTARRRKKTAAAGPSSEP